MKGCTTCINNLDGLCVEFGKEMSALECSYHKEQIYTKRMADTYVGTMVGYRTTHEGDVGLGKQYGYGGGSDSYDGGGSDWGGSDSSDSFSGGGDFGGGGCSGDW